jgi:hypothetical protein
MATGDPWVFAQRCEEEPPSFYIEGPAEKSIVLHCGNEEMLRIAKDGFYVRGVKLEQDDNEISEVYNCFKEWLTWSTLNRT